MNALEIAGELRRLSFTIRALSHRLRRALRNPETPDFELEIIMSALDDAISAQTAAVAAETTAVTALIAKVNATPTEPTADQLAAIAANTSASAANTTAIDTVLNPPAPVAEPETPAT